VLSTKFRVSAEDARDMREEIRGFTKLIAATEALDVVKADPTDNKVLECAVAAGSETVITGDRHLLELGTFRAIKIMTVSDFIAHARGR